MSNAFFIQGMLYSDLREPRIARSVKVDIDEIHTVLKKTIGIGVRLEHKGPSIGKVVDAFILPDKTNALVHIFVDASSQEGARARLGVINKQFRGLSFGSVAKKRENGIRDSEYTPVEVSIVKEGGVDRAYITLWGDRMTDLHCSLQRFNDVFTKTMSESKAEESRVALAAVEPTQDQDKEAKAVFDVFKSIGVNGSNAKDFLKLAASAMNNNSKQYSLVLKGDDNRMGLAEFAQKTLTPEQLEEFELEMRRELETRVSGPSAHFLVTAAALGNFQEELKKGEAAIAELEALKKQHPKPVAEEERKVSTSHVPAFTHNAQILQEAFSFKRQRVDNPEANIQKSREEVLSLIRAAPPKVEISFS